MSRTELTPQQLLNANELHAAFVNAANSELRQLAELLASKDDRTFLGATEFQIRDIVLKIGANALQKAIDLQKKTAMTAPADVVPPVRTMPSSNAGNPNGS